MIPWSKYPYLDLHDLNLDWILEVIKQLDGEMDEFKALNKITFDGEWDITKQYPAWCIVNTGGGTQGYISIKPVPAGVVITNTDYWASIVDYSAVIGDLQNRVVALESASAAHQNAIDALNALVSSGRLDKFKNKKICIVGDSLSDNTTYPPNWTTYFTTAMNAIGASVVNVAQNGYSIVGISIDPSYIPTDCDIYLMFLGINDIQGQFKASDIYSAFSTIYNHICQNESKEFYYISPIKCTMSFGSAAMTPKIAYRHLFEKLAKIYGMHVISGYNAPILNGLNASIYLADTLHASTLYAPILADYILRCMIDENETMTGPYDGTPNVITPIPAVGAGAVYLQYRGGPQMFYASVNLAGCVFSNGGWEPLFAIGTNDGLTYGGSIVQALKNDIDGTTYQTRLNGNAVEIYIGAGTYNLSGLIIIGEYDISVND